jgi:hypothetical protein
MAGGKKEGATPNEETLDPRTTARFLARSFELGQLAIWKHRNFLKTKKKPCKTPNFQTRRVETTKTTDKIRISTY